MSAAGGVLSVIGTAAALQSAVPATRAYPPLPSVAATVADFVAREWIVAAKAEGDLNHDGRNDIVLALWPEKASRAINYAELQDAPAYRLVIGFAQPNGGYRLVTDNHDLLVPPGASGASEGALDADTLRITGGELDIYRELLRGHYRYRFRWSKGAFRLIDYDYAGSDGHCITITSIDYLTRRATIEVEPVGQDDRAKKTARRIKAAPLRTLEEIGSDADWYPEQAIVGSWPTCG